VTAAPSAPRFNWSIALILSAAIAISYLDRQTLPWAIKNIQADIAITNQMKAALDSAFLATYGLMYLGGGWLLDRIGTKRGFAVIMVFWSLACASHGLAGGVLALAASRLLLGFGEGGGFPAATRAVAEWFPVHQRSLAMGMINAGTAIGAVAAPPVIAIILTQVDWAGLSSWRWMFFFTGALGLLWAVWWWFTYRTPTTAPAAGRDATDAEDGPAPTLPMLLARGEVVSVAAAKFLTDAAWYFYIFWLPKYLFDAWNLDLKAAASIGWIPYAAAGVGCLVGGYFSGWLLKRGRSVNFSRKAALGLSAAMMPWVMLVPAMPNVGLVMVLFSLAFFGQQSWSTLIMTLPTDMVPRGSLGKFAGLVGMGGAFGGVVMGTVAGWMLDHGFSYTPVLVIAGSLHLLAFGLICVAIPNLQRLVFAKKA
jgi:ACS family hexuronate transporter-like MFS transporter